MIDFLSGPYEYLSGGAVEYEPWFMERAYMILLSVTQVAKYLSTYKEFVRANVPLRFRSTGYWKNYQLRPRDIKVGEVSIYHEY